MSKTVDLEIIAPFKLFNWHKFNNFNPIKCPNDIISITPKFRFNGIKIDENIKSWQH